jgi:hypothetical protein
MSATKVLFGRVPGQVGAAIFDFVYSVVLQKKELLLTHSRPPKHFAPEGLWCGSDFGCQQRGRGSHTKHTLNKTSLSSVPPLRVSCMGVKPSNYTYRDYYLFVHFFILKHSSFFI